MNTILLGYLCGVLTLVGVYCVREWRNATTYRRYIMPLLTDMQSAKLVSLERELAGELQHVVARGNAEHDDEREGQGEPAMQGDLHALIVAAKADVS